MRNYLIKSVVAAIYLTMVLVPAPVKAQSGTALYISVNPTTIPATGWAGVTGVVINDSAAKIRITVTFTAMDPCGTETRLGYNRLVLGPGQQVLVTTAYPTTSCLGVHTVTISTGGGKTAGVSATAYLTVQ